MAYEVAQEQAEQERERHAHLAAVFDPESIRLLAELGVGPGWRCLEVGLVKAGLIDAEEAEAAIRQAREADFAILSPIAMRAWGRVPD